MKSDQPGQIKDLPTKVGYVLPKIMRATMQRRGLSFTALSRSSGVPVKTLYHWANGQHPRSLANVYALAKALELSIERLAFGDATKEFDQDIFYELVLYRVSADGFREKSQTVQNSVLFIPVRNQNLWGEVIIGLEKQQKNRCPNDKSKNQEKPHQGF